MATPGRFLTKLNLNEGYLVRGGRPRRTEGSPAWRCFSCFQCDWPPLLFERGDLIKPLTQFLHQAQTFLGVAKIICFRCTDPICPHCGLHILSIQTLIHASLRTPIAIRDPPPKKKKERKKKTEKNGNLFPYPPTHHYENFGQIFRISLIISFVQSKNGCGIEGNPFLQCLRKDLFKEGGGGGIRKASLLLGGTAGPCTRSLLPRGE